MEVIEQLHAPDALPREKKTGIHRIGGWVDPRAGLDDMEGWKFLTPQELELRLFSRLASS
jgi:hypothetical protein